MIQELRQWLMERDEAAIDEAFFEEECPHFFSVDWREEDSEIVALCAGCPGVNSLHAEWHGDELAIIYNNSETRVPLAHNEGDRDLTIRTLNDVLQPDCEIRYLVCSHGNDSAGFVVLPAADWRSLDSELSQSVNENFIKLNLLPNVFTEMTDKHLPEAARARFQRMLDRNRRQ